MSLVSGRDQARALALLGSGSSKRDAMLLSLARQRTWTTAQRELVDRMWNDERIKRKEDTMRSTRAIVKGLVLGVALAGALSGLPGCMSTFEKRVTDEDGHVIVRQETRERNPFINWIAPEWMNVRREVVIVDDVVLTDRSCAENLETLAHLSCTPTMGR